MNRVRQVVALIAGSAALAALGLGALIAVLFFAWDLAPGLFRARAPLPSLPFASDAWRAASATDESEDSVRLLMARSFLETHPPVGRTRDLIVALLGEPDDTPYFREYQMVYHLGPERGPFGIDCEWLVLRVENGVVSEARIVVD